MAATPDDDTPAGIDLSDLQLDLMRVLWRGEASVADVAAEMALRRGLAHTTVATVLTRLAKRGLVAARRDGRQLVYRALVDESQVRRSMVGGLIQFLSCWLVTASIFCRWRNWPATKPCSVPRGMKAGSPGPRRRRSWRSDGARGPRRPAPGRRPR